MCARVVVLDTETTGFSPVFDRLVDVAAIEVDPRTGALGNRMQELVNPLRPIPIGVVKIHGITDEDVRDKPSFPGIARRLADFISGSTLVIHNSRFDAGVLNAEFERAGLPKLPELRVRVVDSISVARALLPFLPRYTLDHVCDGLSIDRSHRTLHGALLDALLLAEALPRFYGLYQSLLCSDESQCDIPYVDCRETLTRLLNDSVSLSDFATAEATEESFNRLSRVASWYTAQTNALRGRWEAANDSDWCCKHYVGRYVSTSYTSWKLAAEELLAPTDIAPYMSIVRSQTLRPAKHLDSIGMERWAQALTTLPSRHAICSAMMVLASCGNAIEKARRASRDRLLEWIDLGYKPKSAQVSQQERTVFAYGSAIRDLAFDADLTPYKIEKTAFRVRSRAVTSCEALFGSDKEMEAA